MKPDETFYFITTPRPFEADIASVDTAIAEKVIANLEIHGHEFKNKKLTPELIKESELLPKYRVKIGETVVWLSEQYELSSGRPAIMAYIKKNKKYITRSFYLSNSQGVWRYLPEYKENLKGELDWYGKGYKEQSITLPIVLQKSINKIFAKKDKLKVEDPDFLFAGTCRKIKKDKKGTRTTTMPTFYGEVSVQRKRLQKKYKRFDKVEPGQVEVAKNEDLPDFNQLLASFKSKSAKYGEVINEVYSSKNKKYTYLFCRDKKDRVWLGHVESTSSRIKSTGLKSSWVDAEDLLTPAYEYVTQGGGYGNYDDIDTSGNYVDMFKNYLSKIPVIKEYLKQKNKLKK